MNIPARLSSVPQWVCWKAINNNNGKVDKIPINPYSGEYAKSNDPSTWSNYETAANAVSKYKLTGIGFMFANGYFGVDIDHCIDNGIISDYAKSIISKLRSYTEISPSRTGIHIICIGALPPGNRRNDKLEMYEHGRFFTITGNVFGEFKDIQERTSEIKEIHEQYLGSHQKQQPKILNPDNYQIGNLTADEIIKKACESQNGTAFKELYEGNWTNNRNYPSQSEADLAFCNMLAFWTCCDSSLMDKIMRSSGLMRDKWDRKQSGSTYGEYVIKKAIRDCSTVYDPQVQNTYDYKFNFNKSVDNSRSTGNTNNAFGEAYAVPKEYTMDDTGNAHRFRDLNHDFLKYSYINKVWYYWDSTVWQEDNCGEVKRAVDKTIDSMWKELYKVSESERDARSKWCNKTRFNRTKMAMIAEAQHLEGMQVHPHQLDSKTDIVNAKNGIIDLRTGELLPHSSEMYCTKIINANYYKDAKCPNWEQFLKDITNNDEDLMRFIQKAVGYSLTGSTREQCMFFCYGTGRNGKSTFLETVAKLLGNYAMNCQAETIMMKSSNSSVTSDIARLKGARFVTTVEPNEGASFNEGLIKQLTGGDIVTARFLYGKEFEYSPEFKIWLAANNKPRIRGTDEGIWRRMRLIPFTVTIPEEKKDVNLKYKLAQEIDGILKWAVDGCIIWQTEGLGLPQAIAEATKEYKSEMDILKNFIDECTVNGPGEIKAAELYECYVNWAEKNNEHVMTSTKFGREMSKRCDSSKSMYGKVYKGIRITCNYKKEDNKDNNYKFVQTRF